MKEGWIKLHRKFQDHWLNEPKRPRTKREAWEDMLMTVNYDHVRVLIHGELIECDRGQSLLSIDNWASRFGWSRMQVRTFFRLLENDKMITTEPLHYTTRLTICNYEIYQGDTTDEQPSEQPADNQPITSQQPADNRPITGQKPQLKKNKKNKNINNTNPAGAREKTSLLDDDLSGHGITYEELEEDFLNNFSMKEDLMRKHGMSEATYDKILNNWLTDRKVAKDWNFKQSPTGAMLKRTQSDLRAYFTNYLSLEYEKIKNQNNGKPARITTLTEAANRALGYE